MLATLRVRHFALVDDLSIDFHSQLNVLTGETGAGKSLLIPFFVFECSTIPQDPDFGADEDALRECVEDILPFVDECSVFEAEIDGVSIDDIDRYLTRSPLFDLGPIPEDGLLGAPAGATGQSLSASKFLLLAPPSAGEHVIHVRASLPVCAPGVTFDLTYNITVED